MMNDVVTNDGVQELPLYLLDDDELIRLRLTTLNIFYRQLAENNGELEGSKMVSMNSSILQAVDKKYKAAIAFLLEHSALSTTNHYAVGIHSKPYHIEFAAVKQILGALSFTQLERLAKIRYERCSAFFAKHPEYALKPNELEEDVEVFSDLNNPVVNDVCFKTSNDQHAAFKKHIELLEAKGEHVDFYIKLIASMRVYNKSIYGRIYCNGSNLPTNYISAEELRNNPESQNGVNYKIKYLGKPVCGNRIYSIDKVAAHPTFLAHILRASYEEWDTPASRGQANLIINSINNGMDFYTEICPNDRNAGKRACMLFLNDRTHANNPMYQYLQKEYPDFLRAALALKDHNGGMLWKPLNIAEFNLMRSKDGLINQYVRLCRKQMKDNPKHAIKVLDAHDGIYVQDGVLAAQALKLVAEAQGYQESDFSVDVFDANTHQLLIKKMPAEKLRNYASENVEESMKDHAGSNNQSMEDWINEQVRLGLDKDYDIETESLMFADAHREGIQIRKMQMKAEKDENEDKGVKQSKNDLGSLPLGGREPTHGAPEMDHSENINQAVGWAKRLISGKPSKDCNPNQHANPIEPKPLPHITLNAKLGVFAMQKLHTQEPEATITESHPAAPPPNIKTNAEAITSNVESIPEAPPRDTNAQNTKRPAQFRGRDTELTFILLKKMAQQQR